MAKWDHEDLRGKVDTAVGTARRDPEQVDHPDHYGGKENQYETIKVLGAWLTGDEMIGFLKGNVIKYLSRHRMKGGFEDLKKAQWYQNTLISYMEALKISQGGGS